MCQQVVLKDPKFTFSALYPRAGAPWHKHPVSQGFSTPGISPWIFCRAKCSRQNFNVSCSLWLFHLHPPVPPSSRTFCISRIFPWQGDVQAKTNTLTSFIRADLFWGRSISSFLQLTHKKLWLTSYWNKNSCTALTWAQCFDETLFQLRDVPSNPQDGKSHFLWLKKMNFKAKKWKHFSWLQYTLDSGKNQQCWVEWVIAVLCSLCEK